MKKLIVLSLLVTLALTMSGCSKKEKLYILNWGEYMDPEVIELFEDEFNVTVVTEEVDSNEAMEVKIKAGNTPYDIAFPSDYMIDKLRQQGKLNEIDYDLLPGFDNVSLLEDVTSLYSGKGYEPYFVPYFWGTVGIMYNTTTVDEADLTGWEILFESETVSGNSYDVAMYDSARDSVAAALLYLGYSVNSNDADELDEAQQVLIDANFKQFGTDELKGLVDSANIDLALVYSGDYFDRLYVVEEEGLDVDFGYFVPETTNIWVDGFVIPTTSENTDLAHEFINFFLGVEVSAQNSDWVGYAPVLAETYALLVSDEYGYDYDNYNPAGDGENDLREMYEFISDERFDKLNQILNAAKAN